MHPGQLPALKRLLKAQDWEGPLGRAQGCVWETPAPLGWYWEQSWVGLKRAGRRQTWGWLPHRGDGKEEVLQPGLWSPKSGLFCLLLIYFNSKTNIYPL